MLPEGIDVRCCDCLSPEGLPSIPDGTVDAVITDPPYVIGAVSAGNLNSKAGTWHDMMNSAYWFSAWYREVWRVLKRNGSFWTFCSWRGSPVVMAAASQASIPITSVLVWDKDWIGPGGEQGLRPAYELVALAAKPDFAIKNRGLRDIWTVPWSAHKPHGHPAEKPIELIQRIMNAIELPEDGIVLDPFLGSGTTAEACYRLGRRCIGMEKEPKYVDIAKSRLRQQRLIL